MSKSKVTFETKSVPAKDIQIPKIRDREDYGDLKSLARSISRIGCLHPPILDDNLNLIAGERRVRAQRENLGYSKIEVRIHHGVDAEALSEDEKRMIEMEENALRKDLTYVEKVGALRRFHEMKQRLLGEGKVGVGHGWGMRDTATALGLSLGTVSMDIKLAKAFKEHPELMEEKDKKAAYKKLKRFDEQEADLTATELAEKTGYKPESLILGDNLEIMKSFPDKSIDLLYTDPPYGIDFGSSHEIKERWIEAYTFGDKEKEVLKHLTLVLVEAYRLLKDDTHAYVWCAFRFVQRIQETMKNIGFYTFGQPLIWIKATSTGALSPYTYASAYEVCIHAMKGKRKIKKQGQKNWFQIPRKEQGKKIHPTEKPIDLIVPMIEQSSNYGDVVLDPYAGSASTLVAAYSCKRNAIGIEIKEEYYDAAVVRLLGGEK